MEENYICFHEKLEKHANYNFCLKCGSTLFGNMETLKPSRYNYLIEISPLQMWDNMKKSTIMTQKPKTCQKYLQKRNELIMNIRIITNKFHFRNQSFYLAVHYLDIILSSSTLDVKYELVALCCLIIAAKFDENDPIVPNLSEWEAEYNKCTFTSDELKKGEIFCVKTLGYKLNYFTPYHFISFFIIHGYVFKEEIASQTSKPRDKQMANIDSTESLMLLCDKIYNTAKEILICYVDENNYLNFSPLQIACSCIAISREANKLRDAWSSFLEMIYEIRAEDFQPCITSILNSIPRKVVTNTDLGSYLFSKKNIVYPKLSPKRAGTICYKNYRSNKASNSLGHEELNKIAKEANLRTDAIQINSPQPNNDKTVEKTKISKLISPLKKEQPTILKTKAPEEEIPIDKPKIQTTQYSNYFSNARVFTEKISMNRTSAVKPEESKTEITIDRLETEQGTTNTNGPRIVKKRSLNINLGLKPNNVLNKSNENEEENPSRVMKISKRGANVSNNESEGNGQTKSSSRVKEIQNVKLNCRKEVGFHEESSNSKDIMKNYNTNVTVRKSSNKFEYKPSILKDFQLPTRPDFQQKVTKLQVTESSLTNGIGIMLKKLNSKGSDKGDKK